MYDKKLTFYENVRQILIIFTFIILISGIMTSIGGFYLDYKNDQRYLQLLDIASKLDPIYVSITSFNEKIRQADITTLENKIFDLEFKQSELAAQTPKLSLPPYEYAVLGRYKSQLKRLQDK